MSGLKGRRISADMFAMMLKVPVGELVFAARHGRVRQGGVNSEPAFRLGNVCVMR